MLAPVRATAWGSPGSGLQLTLAMASICEGVDAHQAYVSPAARSGAEACGLRVAQTRAAHRGDRARLFLVAETPERLKERLGRRLDRLFRQVERLERNVTISNEALALFVRFWLTTTPSLPTAAHNRPRKRRPRAVRRLRRCSGPAPGEGPDAFGEDFWTSSQEEGTESGHSSRSLSE